jgi:hypothetical protein
MKEKAAFSISRGICVQEGMEMGENRGIVMRC